MPPLRPNWLGGRLAASLRRKAVARPPDALPNVGWFEGRGKRPESYLGEQLYNFCVLFEPLSGGPEAPFNTPHKGRRSLFKRNAGGAFSSQLVEKATQSGTIGLRSGFA